MKTWIFILTVTTLTFNKAFSLEFRVDDGKAVYAVATVNGKIAWTQQEKDRLISAFNQFEATSPVTVVNFTPSNFELSVASSGIKFLNFTDLDRALKDSQHLQDKIDDMPPSEKRKNEATITALESENQKDGAVKAK